MIVMSASIVISLLIAGLPQASLTYQPLAQQLVVQPTLSVSSKFPASELEYFEEILLPFGELNEGVCPAVPSGLGIPGFRPGVSKSDVLRILGVPNVSASGYWPKTDAASYELIPDQVSLGFLFDRKSEKVRQTEAAFTPTVNSQVIALTLNGMLGCKLNEPIKQGLEQVQQGQSPRHTFTLDSLKGLIERDKRDRIYIGIWEGDLH